MFKEERYEINSSSTGITESDGTGATWKDIWDFKVPVNQWIVLSPGDIFSCYLIGDDAAEMPKATRVRIVKRDVTNEDSKPVLPELPYQQVKQFTDRDLLMHLAIVDKVIVGAEEHIVVQVNGIDAATTGDLDASASYFKIFTHRRKKVLA